MRIFIGIDIEEGCLRQSLLSWQQYAAPLLGERWRMTASYNFHLTLRFLGQVAEAQVAKISENLPGWVADSAPMNISSQSLKLLPGDEKVRVVTLAFENTKDLQGMVDRINSGLMSLGFDAPDLPFLPHITLARHKGKPLSGFEINEVEWRESSPMLLSVRGVTLFSSESSLHGVVYRPLMTCDLKNS